MVISKEVEETKKKINTLLNELAAQTSKKMRGENSQYYGSINPVVNLSLDAENDEAIQQIEDQLNELGVHEISQEEADEIKNGNYQSLDNNDTNTTTNSSARGIYVPTTTKYTKFYSFSYKISSGGITYDVTDLYAQGLNEGSQLVTVKDGAVFVKKEDAAGYVFKNGMNLLSIYVQKGLGYIPGVQLFPYELLFSSTDTVKTVGITISYNLIQTYCYIYVKPENKSSTYYDMYLASNMIYVDSGIMHRSLKNGKSNITYQSKTETVYSTAYANGSYAVDNYKNATAHGDSFVYGYQYRNPRGTEKLSISYGIYNAPGFITK